MITPEVNERERTVTSVDAAGNGQQTTTRTTGPGYSLPYRMKSAVWLIVGVVDLVLALDFVFKLAAAANVGFVGFISVVAGSLASPFSGVLATSVPNGHPAHWPDVVGIVVYLIAAWIVVSLIRIGASRQFKQPVGL